MKQRQPERPPDITAAAQRRHDQRRHDQRRHEQRSPLSVLLVLSLLIFAPAPVVVAGDSGGSSNGAPVRLQPGSPVARELGGGQVHEYLVALPAEHFFHLVVEQHDADVVVTVIDPGGTAVDEIDSPIGDQGQEELLLVTDEAGEHLVQVSSLAAAGSIGGYRARIAELRPAAAADRYRVEADRLSRRGLMARLSRKREGQSRAIELYQQALPLWRRAGDRGGEAKTLFTIGVCYRRLGEYTRAIEHYQAALPLWREIGSVPNEIDTLNNLGYACSRVDDNQGALRHYQESLELARTIADPARLGLALNNLGKKYLDLSEPDKALEYLLEALTLRQAEGDPIMQMRTLNNLGTAYQDLGEYHQALQATREALQLGRTLGSRRELVAPLLNNLGTIYDSLGQLEQAQLYFEQALRLNREVGDRKQEAMTLINIGRVQHFEGAPDQALDAFEQAQALLVPLKDRRNQAKTLFNMGTTLAASGRPRPALDSFQKALAMSRELGDRREEARILAQMASVSLELGQLKDSLAGSKQALALSRKVMDYRTQAFALQLLAAANKQQGRLLPAQRHIEAAIEIIESLRSSASGHEHRAAFLALKRTYYEEWIDLLMTLHQEQPQAGFQALALRASERARARSLIDMLEETRIDPGAGSDPKLLEQEQTLKRRLNALELRRSRRHDPDPRAGGQDALEQEVETTVAELRAVRSRVRAMSPRYRALTEPPAVDLQTLQHGILDRETVLLEYTLGQERSFLWLVTPAAIQGFELPGRATLDAAARQLYELLTARERSIKGETLAGRQERISTADQQLDRAAADLATQLLGPVAGRLAGKRLVIVSEGALEYVPFAALPIPGSFGPSRPLVLEHEIVRLPSVTVLAALRRQAASARATSKSLLVVADPVFTGDDPRLVKAPDGTAVARLPAADEPPVVDELRFADSGNEQLSGPLRRLRYSRREAEGIAALLAADDVTLALDLAASRDLVTSSRLGEYRLVHFATHGLVSSRYPELSALALAMVDEQGRPADGFLRLHDIYNLELNAELVVLSACQTALGREIRGEGLVGLTRGFMYAGAPRILASLWTVQDRATAELMTRFYQRLLKENETPAAALRAAQISLLRQKRTAAPYYWAAFVLQGEWW